MKHVLLATVGMLVGVACVGSAGAADLGRRYDPVVPKAPYLAAIYNWTGFYVGVNGGGGFGHSTWTSTGGFDLSGGLVGGTAGYNWQTGQFVLGVEGDLDWSGIKGQTTVACAAGCQTSNTWLGTVRGRVGYAFDRFMPYVTGGLAVGDIRARPGVLPGVSNTNAGWTVGGGLEFAFAGNWTAKAEYLYVDLGTLNCGLACGAAVPDNVTFTSHVLRGGVNFRF
jgi:outer membrane immunogenic protein